MFTEPCITSKSHSWVVIAISKSITVCKKLGSSFCVYITLHLSVWDFVCCLIRITQHNENPLQFSAVKLCFYYNRCFSNVSKLCHLGVHPFSGWITNILNSSVFSRNLCYDLHMIAFRAVGPRWRPPGVDDAFISVSFLAEHLTRSTCIFLFPGRFYKNFQW